MRKTGLSPAAAALALGAPLALLFLLPVLRFAGWFLRSLVHEIGHTAAAWAFGCPAFPAIRLDGHAAAFHRDQVLLLALLVWAALAWAAWRWRGAPRLRVVLFPAAALYPLLAFTGAREAIHILAGHLGELAFAGIFFHRALTGGFSGISAERPLYAALAWFWSAGVFLLGAGLLFSSSARASYSANRSFGIVNDLERLAAMTGIPLGGLAFLLMLLALLPLPIAWFLSRPRTRSRGPRPPTGVIIHG